MADDQPDVETERVSMLWPKDLKAQVQTLVGKRGLTTFTVDAVQRSLEEKVGTAAVPTAPSAERVDVDGDPTDIGTPITEHMLVAVRIDYEPAPSTVLTFELNCRCGLQIVGISKTGDQTDGMAAARAKWEARSLVGSHPAPVLSGRDISAVPWFQNDPDAGAKVAEIQDLIEVGATATVSVTDPDSGVTRSAGPPTVHHDVRISAPSTGEPFSTARAISAQISEKIRSSSGEPTAHVVDLKERFGMQTASEIEPPPPPPVVPVDLTEPAAPTAAETGEESTPSSGTCPNCFSPLIDGTCWSCSI